MTLQQATERRPKKIDLNILPAEYRPPKKSHLGIILYMIVFVLICAAALVLVMKSGVDSDVDSRNQTLSNLQQQFNELQANKAEADPIKQKIANAQNQLANIEADYSSFLDNRLLWSRIIDEINELVPGKKISLWSISTTEDSVTITGLATKRIYVYDYASALEESDFFDNVNFSFGDCPETDNCNFTVTVQLTETNLDTGETDE
jgi:Tfp pilus assembly protein PilN